jgi:hypothetical protein
MHFVPPRLFICRGLAIEPSTLQDSQNEVVAIKAESRRLLLSMAVSQLPFDANWYCGAHPDRLVKPA